MSTATATTLRSTQLGNSQDPRYLDASNLSGLLDDRVSRLEYRMSRLTAQHGLGVKLALSRMLTSELERQYRLETAIQEAHWAWEDRVNHPCGQNYDFLERCMTTLDTVRREVEAQIGR